MSEDSAISEARKAYREQAEDVGIKPPEKFRVDDYTTFRAEYLLRGDDIIIHFYKTDEMIPKPGYPDTTHVYWGRTFPSVLSTEAQEFFGTGRPRLEAAFTEEVDSWYFRARGFAASTIDPHGYIKKFLERLDTAIDKAKEG